MKVEVGSRDGDGYRRARALDNRKCRLAPSSTSHFHPNSLDLKFPSGVASFKMAPRKRTKRAHSPTPQDDTMAQSSADTPSSDSAGKPDPDYDLISDPWTDEQETALLKAIIKWKPVGLFNYAGYEWTIATNHLIPQVYTNTFGCSRSRITSRVKVMLQLQLHTCAFPGSGRSWKLYTTWKPSTSGQVTSHVIRESNSLTRAQEDSLITDSNEDDDAPSEMYCPFELPYDDYGDMMFERRLAIEDSLSPVASRASRAADSRRGSTVADTDGKR